MTDSDRFHLLNQAYKKRFETVFPEISMDDPSFVSVISERLSDLPCVEAEADGQYGFLYYDYREDGIAHITVPVYGYYAENEKMMVRLFRKLADEAGKRGTVEYSFHLYSRDHDCLQALHMMQFGNMAEKGIKKITVEPVEPLPGISVRELDKEEIDRRWADVWNAVHQIILHLTESPVFYPGTEFTEEKYREFFMDRSVHVIAAATGERIIGIIEWNEEKNPLIAPSCDSVNVGEAFVYPAYRGTGLSHRLLKTAEKDAYRRGARYMWVEHGTANPEARGFWNKYFSTYQYELVRVITR